MPETEWPDFIGSGGSSANEAAADAPEDCKLVAHDTGDGWYLGVENRDGDNIAILKWPWGDNEKKNAKQLREYGYEIV